MSDYVQKILAQAPPLTDERRAKLSQIFGGVKCEPDRS